jgi:hypothetical protein
MESAATTFALSSLSNNGQREMQQGNAKELYGLDAGAAGASSWRSAGDTYPMFHIEQADESYAIVL